MPNYLNRPKHNFKILTDGDESFEIWLNGKRLITLNHDEHGWKGIEAAIYLTNEIAKEIGAEAIEGRIRD